MKGLRLAISVLFLLSPVTGAVSDRPINYHWLIN